MVLGFGWIWIGLARYWRKEFNRVFWFVNSDSMLVHTDMIDMIVYMNAITLRILRCPDAISTHTVINIESLSSCLFYSSLGYIIHTKELSTVNFYQCLTTHCPPSDSVATLISPILAFR